MTSITTKGVIVVGVAVAIALCGAVSMAEAGRKGGGGGVKGGGGGLRVSSHAFKGSNIRLGSGAKFHGSGSKALRHSGGSKLKFSSHGKPHANAKKGSGKYATYQRYGKSKYAHYRRYNHYGWYGLPLYAYGGSCGWLYRQAVATGSDYWWDRYYRCTRYY